MDIEETLDHRDSMIDHSGQLVSKDACVPAGNISEAMKPKRQSFDYAIRTEGGHTLLCLSGRPFQFDEKQST